MIVYSNGFRFNVSALEAGGSIKLIGTEEKQTPLACGNYIIDNQRLIFVREKGVIADIIEKKNLKHYYNSLLKKSTYKER